MVSTNSAPEWLKADKDRFFLLAGPCVVESEELVMNTAESIKSLAVKYNLPVVFKASYRKANRSKLDSYTGPGDDEALRILQKVKEELDMRIVTDIHTDQEADLAAEVADILQIPAFLCRQTDLLVAAGNTGKVVNIKKGQFVSAHSMKYALEKVKSTGNNNSMLTERGSMFGYQDLIVDFRSIVRMKELGAPVVMDCTHSVQQPNAEEGQSGGLPEYIETMAKAGIVSGSDGLFIETHPNPSEGLSDATNMLALSKLDGLLEKCVRVKEAL